MWLKPAYLEHFNTVTEFYKGSVPLGWIYSYFHARTGVDLIVPKVGGEALPHC